MAEKHVQVVTKPSNREKGKDAREKKAVFKGMLDNPFRIQWPSLPLNLQNAILADILQRLQGISEYQCRRFSENRKRKRKENAVPQPPGKRPKAQTEQLADVVDRDIVENPLRNSTLDASLYNPPEQANLDPPILFRHLVFGINEVTKRLELQTRAVRQPVIASWPDQPVGNLPPALKFIFVCRSDVKPTVLVDHLPHVIAAYNASRPPSFVKLVPLPVGAELSLAQALGVRRVTVLGIDTMCPEDQSLISLLEKVPVVTASWLHQSDTLVPTHVKQLRTTAPRDMKAAKELRCEEKARAKQRRRLKQGGT